MTWERTWRKALRVEKSPEAMAEERRRLSVDVIKCLTCNSPNTEWPHGIYPDTGGTAAHTHAVEHPDHLVRVGEINQLVAEANALAKKGR